MIMTRNESMVGGKMDKDNTHSSMKTYLETSSQASNKDKEAIWILIADSTLQRKGIEQRHLEQDNKQIKV
jgi:hypothetical protein